MTADYYKRNKKKIRAQQRNYQHLNRKRITKRRREWRHELKITAFDLLGGFKCVSCGISDRRVLQIDHISGIRLSRNDPRQRHVDQMYRDIVKGKLTKKDLQILCANCNWIKRFENEEFCRPKWEEPQ